MSIEEYNKLRKEQAKRKIDEYNKNPNLCLHCNKPIYCSDRDVLSSVKIKHFCNSSCAASFNNKGVVRNKDGNGVNKSILDKFTDQEIIDFYNTSDTFKELSQKLGYKNIIDRRTKKVHERFDSLGLDFSKFKGIKNIDAEFSSRLIIRKCLKCEKPISHTNKSGYCQDCYRELINNEKIEHWLKTGDTGCAIGSNLRNCIRDYIYKSQDNKCAICGNINMWNGKELKFVLDHIDGNASNNDRDNLRLICPNCDSQLDTYKSKNKNSARNFRHKYYELNNKNAG